MFGFGEQVSFTLWREVTLNAMDRYAGSVIVVRAEFPGLFCPWMNMARHAITVRGCGC